ncbi:imm11 family protein [Paremcibacter congregatus]|uniref:imm11 family protein n=1 Tax=Paremcibacter congregatus TaxID=2043170 RepID=UPI0030ECDDBC|tara:strand:- start:1107 stop:1727 length:621 start_codon:yes stop_codon:yes gene_type:complete
MAYAFHGGKQENGTFMNPYTPLDGDMKKVAPIDCSQDGGLRISHIEPFTTGRPVDPTYVPTRLKRGGPSPSKQPLLEIGSFNAGGLLVSEQFKEILEGLEPGVHQFFPMEIEQRGKYLGKRYLFVIGNRLDSLNRAHSIPKTDPGTLFSHLTSLGEIKKVFDKKSIADHHAWHDKYCRGRYVSDELVAALKAAGLTNFSCIHYDEA